MTAVTATTLRLGAWVKMAIVLAVVIVGDQIAKSAVRADIAPGEEHHVVWFLKFVRVRNTGVAFGAFAGSGGVIVGVLVAVALVALLTYFVTHQDRPLVWLPTGMLLGGSIGNVADRIRGGGVTDFIKVPHWPAFNVADVAITVGVFVLLAVIEMGQRGSDDRTG